MRSLSLALLGVCLTGAALHAQQPPAGAPPVGTAADQLDVALARWEKAMGSINSFVAQCTRTSINKTFQTTEVYEGAAKYLKTSTDNRASLELYKKNRREVFEKFICSGTYLYEFSPKDQEIRVHEMPKPPAGQVADDNFLSFLFGMKANEAKRRYQLTWLPPPPKDTWYHYIDIRPLSPADKSDFTRARLVLTASTFLPRQLWFEQPNGNEVSWDFPQVATNTELRPQEFAEPTVPQGWRMVRVPRQGPAARVIRQQN
jgi:TIGR03009 family protein